MKADYFQLIFRDKNKISCDKNKKLIKLNNQYWREVN
jgi:hypothetical protein